MNFLPAPEQPAYSRGFASDAAVIQTEFTAMSEIAAKTPIIYLGGGENILIVEIGQQLLPVREIGRLSFGCECRALGKPRSCAVESDM